MVKYCAGLIAMDEAIDDVFKALKETDMFSNSVVVLSSDNGGRVHYPEQMEAKYRKDHLQPGFLGMTLLSPFGSSYPYRGGKFDQSEGAYRIPGLIYSPLLPDSAKGTTYPGLFHLVDWLPTLYGLAAEGFGAMDTALDGLSLDGYDMWSALTGSGDPRQFVLLQYPNAYIQKETLNGETKLWKVVFGRLSYIEGSESPIVFFEPGNTWVNSTCLDHRVFDVLADSARSFTWLGLLYLGLLLH
mmetsp:Transcript_38336/g.91585  ORF Transcript_38336/g.91585 Transcript_38336/m.91585 type:complete len:243 (+) Transcript_38336:2-730(+)